MEWVAIPFGLCTAPSTFERMMNDILRDFSQKFVTVNLDDVYIYSRILEEHLEHLRRVLQRFKEEGLKLRLKKCFFGLHEMEYIGYTMSDGRISVSAKKVEAAADCQCLRRRRRFAVSYISATSMPDLFIISATLRLH
jgi:hypothetical protein